MTEAAKKRDGGAGLENHVDFGGRQLEGGALDLLDGFGESFDGDIVEERAGFNQADACRAKRGAIPRSRRFREKAKCVRSLRASRTFYFTGSRESCRPICAIPIPDARSPHRPKKKSCRY